MHPDKSRAPFSTNVRFIKRGEPAPRESSGGRSRTARMFRKRQSPPITEALAYARCHGNRGPELVRVVKLEPRRRDYAVAVSGEALRQAFETKLGDRAT